ncbi:hypothetical protein [Psychrobacter sp. FDAARGOS_221]|uniref:hypothetical protein n=1 Tax=Psychrobacter sp. FDAARGOS_221 TaxID=1975705 RepID=UPI000FDAB4E7|nr:hypothetical protein [Psychrobacter sp. FDAARGOS_221]
MKKSLATRIKSVLIFFIIVFILNYLLNKLMSLGQDLTYVFVLSILTTVVFYIMMAIRGRWSS